MERVDATANAGCTAAQTNETPFIDGGQLFQEKAPATGPVDSKSPLTNGEVVSSLAQALFAENQRLTSEIMSLHREKEDLLREIVQLRERIARLEQLEQTSRLTPTPPQERTQDVQKGALFAPLNSHFSNE